MIIGGDGEQGVERGIAGFYGIREVRKERELVLWREGNSEAGFVEGEGVIVEVSVKRGGDVGKRGVTVGVGEPEASSHCSRAGALIL